MWVRLVVRNYFEWWDWVEKCYISTNGLLLISGYFHTSYSINFYEWFYENWEKDLHLKHEVMKRL